VQGVAYVVDRAHTQYAGSLDTIAAARIVHEAEGQSGPNDAYVFNTLAHLKQMGIRDHWLEDVVDEVERLRAA
jgi:cation transport protein ChaC